MTEIRGLLSKDKELGELKRDIQSALKNIPKFEVKTINGAYEEPMYLLHKTRPTGVLLLSCFDGRDQEDPQDVLAGVFCHWTWDGVKSRIRINSIDGLTPSALMLFRFAFLVVG